MKTSSKRSAVLLFAAALVTIPLCAAAAFAPNEWQWKKPIALPSGTVESGSYVKINIDQESGIYSNPGLSDLRVVRNSMSEVPFQLVTESTKEGKSFIGATIVDRATDDGDMVLIVDVGQTGLRHNAIEVTASNSNYRRQASVYSSDVLLDWSDPKWGWINPSSQNGALVRSTDAFMYRFTDTELGFSAGSGTVFYPETGARFLRIVIHKENNKKELLAIANVRVYREVMPVAKEDEMTVGASFTENQEAQSTEIVVDLGGGGLPTKAITLALRANENFNRRATIQGSADGVNWHLLGQGYLFNIDTPLFRGTELTLRYPESSHRYLRAVVFNDDNQPVRFADAVTLHSILRSVVFAVEEGNSYALYYGNKNANTPRYDLSRYFQYIESVAIPRASLGAQSANSAYAPLQPPKKPFADQYPELVNITLVVLVVLVTLIMFAYIKKLKLEKPGQ